MTKVLKRVEMQNNCCSCGTALKEVFQLAIQIRAVAALAHEVHMVELKTAGK